MILTVKLPVVNQQAKYLGHRSFHLKVTVRTHTHTHPTQCSTWTTKLLGNYLQQTMSTDAGHGKIANDKLLPLTRQAVF